MPFHRIRSRGQAALFAGFLLLVFIPIFSLLDLLPSGYAQAQHDSFAHSYTPLLQWANGHLGLVAAYTILEAIPLLSILALPYTLRRAVHGERGRVAQWLGVAGLILIAAMILINLAFLVSATQQYAQASDAAARATAGTNYRTIAITESLISDVVGGLLISAWLWLINFPLARLPGFERFTGLVGLAISALFGATALLVIYDPQQTYQALAGTTHGGLGLWLGLVGILLIQRAPQLGAEAEAQPAEQENTGEAGAKDTTEEVKAGG
jgi:hypothetical protein